MQVHRMQPTQHLNIQRQIQIVVLLMQILSPLQAVLALAIIQKVKRKTNHRYDADITDCENPNLTTAVIR